MGEIPGKVKEAFSKHSSGGVLDARQLRDALGELGVSASSETGIASMLSKVDVDNSGTLSLPEFNSLFDVVRLRTVFESIDRDGSGMISSREMAGALRQLGAPCTPADARRLLSSVDRNSDGEVSWDEFRDTFRYTPLADLQSVAARWGALRGIDPGSDLAAALPPPTPGFAVWQTVLAGGSAGVAARTLTAPLERVKLAAQTRGLDLRASAREAARIVRAEGARGLFAGNLVHCARVFPTGAMTCTLYQSLLRLTPADSELDAMEPVWRAGCAAAAAAAANAATYPLDVVRVRLTLPNEHGERPAGVVATFRAITNQPYSGAALYAGLRPTLLAVVPLVAVQQTLIDLQNSTAAQCGLQPTLGLLAVIGGVAGMTAQAVVYPLDVLRRRMQLGPAARGGIVSDRTWLALRSVVRKEGVTSLFAGMGPTFLKAIPSAGVSATVCVSMLGFFRRSNAA